ncbi:hypothetical protein PENTCL1PPCAC_3128, partial [Pristionchus entomophagus]
MSLVLCTHYIVGILSIIFNIFLLIVVAKRTPRKHRMNGILIAQECMFMLASSLANFVSMQRLIPIPATTIFASMGVCNNVSPYFCYYFHVLTTSCSGQKALSGNPLVHVKFWWIPFSFFFIGVHITVAIWQSDPEVLRSLVDEFFREFSGDHLSINGHDSFSVPVIIVNSLYITGLPFLYISIALRRRSILALLDSQMSKISERSRQMQRNLVNTVTVHAFFSLIAVCPLSIFGFSLVIPIHNVEFLDSCFFFIQLHCALAPLVTIYYVPNYR